MEKNICSVSSITSMTESTNVLVEENGTLRKLNLYSEFDKQNNFFNNKITELVSTFGTEGIWTYKKDNSGFALCWGAVSSDYHMAGGTTTMPNSTDYSQRTCPFPQNLFIETPLIVVTAIDSGIGVATAEVDKSSSKDNCSVLIWGNLNAFGNINVLAIGRWK